MVCLLSFDTSTDAMSIALQTPDGRVRASDSVGGAQASAALIPALMALLAEAGLTISELDAIAFGCGPGAFTGLRTACSVAQGLAFGAGKPVVPVDSLMLVAEDARRQLQPSTELGVWVAMDARMNEIYAGAYAWADGRWRVLDEPALYGPQALQAKWQEPKWQERAPHAVAGSALNEFALDTAHAQRIPQPSSRAHALAEVAQQLWREGVVVDAAHALPVYLRDKVAQTTAERAAARLVKEGLAKEAPA